MSPTPSAPSQRSGSLSALDLLLHRIALGDQDALAAFYDRTATAVFAAVLDVLGDRARAEHVTADLYLRVWTSRGTWDRAAGTALAWLLGTARADAAMRLERDRDYDPVREAHRILERTTRDDR